MNAKSLGLALAVFASATVGATPMEVRYWIGGASGDWNAATNWSPSGTPGYTVRAVFTNSADVVVTGSDPMRDLRVESGDVTFKKSGSCNFFFRGDDVTDVATFHVATGSTVRCCSGAYPSPYAKIDFKVTGGGTLHLDGVNLSSDMWQKFAVDGATLLVNSGGDGVWCKENMLSLTNGATLRYGGNNCLANGMRIDVSRDSVCDFNKCTDYVGAFTGEGVVTNSGNHTIGLSLYKGPHRFGGRMVDVQVELKPMTSGSYAASEAEAGFIVCTSNALAGLTSMSFGKDSNGNAWIVDDPKNSTLRFASGVGKFWVCPNGAVGFGSGHKFFVGDLAGEPIELYAGFNGVGGLKVYGAGTVVQPNGGSAWHVRTDDLANFSGKISCGNGYVYVGGDNASHDADLSKVGALEANGNGVTFLRNHTPFTYTMPLLGGGRFSALSIADATFNHFSLTNGQIMCWGASSTYSNLTIAGGVSKNAKIDLGSMVDGCELRITGGESDGMTVYPNRTVATNVVLAGGVHTNFTLAAKSDDSASGDYRVTGGTWWFADRMSRSGNHHWTLTGGFMDFVNGLNNTCYGTAANPVGEFTFDVGGDAELIVRRTPSGNYPRGMGIDAHGNAKVTITRNFADEIKGEPLRISSDCVSHTLRVRENAEVKMEAINFVASADTKTDASVTGRVELAGGTLELGDSLSFGLNVRTNNSYGHFIWNGGLLRLSRSQWNKNNSFKAFSNNYAPGLDFTYLGENATEVNVPLEMLSYGWEWNVPLKTLPGVATDGGFVKTGYGYLGFSYPVDTRGPIVLRDGLLVSYSADASAKAFAAPITNVGMCVEFNTSAATASGSIYYDGVARVQLRNNSKGNNDYARITFDALVPVNEKSALLLYDPDDGSFDGNRVTAKLAAGATAYPSVVGQSYHPNECKSYDRSELFHLYYDETNGFISRDYADGAEKYTTTFSADGSAWWHNNCAAQACADDAWVKGVRVARRASAADLTIASGKTLKIGDGANPAFLLLSGCGSEAFVKGGTIDFGTSRGFVLDNAACSGSKFDEVTSVIAGSAGVTFGGVDFRAKPSFLKISGANTYAGGTLVDNVRLQAANAKALSSGAVEVRGGQANGGTVYFTANGTLANSFVISGRGYSMTDSFYTPAQGALEFDANLTLSGSVEVRGEAWIRSASPVKSATISGAVSGGKLGVGGIGTITLIGDNSSLTGGVEIVGGVLAVNSANALGEGAVTIGVDGTLRFVNSAAVNFAHPVVGSGVIELAGAASVNFADLTGFTGTIRKTGTGSLDLAGDDIAVANLVDSGSVVNSGDAATLTVDAESDAQFDGVVSGAISLVKEGDGIQTLSANQSYAGATAVRDGTLLLGFLEATTNLTIGGAVLRLDASAKDSVVADDDGNVISWSDADGRANLVFTNRANASVFATRKAAEINGLDTVWFPGLKNERLFAATPLVHKEVFVAMRPETAAPPEGHYGWTCAGFFGATDTDRGERFASKGTLSDSGYNTSNPSVGYVNGAKTYSIKHGQTSVVCLDTVSAETYPSWSVGKYTGESLPRPFYGDFCELIMFPRSLGDLDRARVTEYLMVKWGVKEQTAWQKLADVLPTTTDLFVADGATLDLWGSDQTVKSLSGAGAIANSASGHRAKLVVTEDSEFDGAIGADVDLVIGAGVHFTFGPNATIDENAVITALDGATLELSGHEFRVRQYRGYKFQVSNGSFVSQIRYCPGTYLIVR